MQSARRGGDETIADLVLYLEKGVAFPRHNNGEKSFHGIAAREVTAGLQVHDVQSRTFADRLGLRSGDLLVELGGAGIFGLAELSFFTKQHASGEHVEAAWVRDGELMWFGGTWSATTNNRPLKPEITCQKGTHREARTHDPGEPSPQGVNEQCTRRLNSRVLWRHKMTPRPATHDRELLEIQVATLFVLADTGRIQRENDPDRSAGPRLYLAGCESGNVVRTRRDVGEDTVRATNALVADEPPLRDPDGTPLHLDEYVELLSREAPVEQRTAGVIYTLPVRLEYEHEVTLVRSDSPDGEGLIARLTERGMPETLAALGFVDVGEFWPPWCVAVHGDEIASVGITARIGPTGAEADVTTVPALRGRGFPASATAGWASHPSLVGRALFYSTDRTNVSSQRVAERLGLRFIGASLRIT